MKRTLPFVILLVASVAAGIWLFAPARTVPEVSVEACGEKEGSCSAEVAPEPAAGVPPPAAPEAPSPPPGADAAKEPAPAVAAEDGPRLRADADRLLAEGKIREGIDALRKATEADPSARNHGDLGSLLLRLTAIDEALVHLRRAADLDPGSADRWIALANAYYIQVDPGQAWKAEARARQAEPGLALRRNSNGLWVRQEPRQSPQADDSAAGKP